MHAGKQKQVTHLLPGYINNNFPIFRVQMQSGPGPHTRGPSNTCWHARYGDARMDVWMPQIDDGWMRKRSSICVLYVLGINSPGKLTVQGQQGPGQGECIIRVQMTIDWNWKSARMWARLRRLIEAEAPPPCDHESDGETDQARRAWPRALDRRRRFTPARWYEEAPTVTERKLGPVRPKAAAPPSTSPPAECRLYMGRAAAAGNPAGRARHRGTFLPAAGAGGGLHLSSPVPSSACAPGDLSLYFCFI
jgi:hypothetical protein